LPLAVDSVHVVQTKSFRDAGGRLDVTDPRRRSFFSRTLRTLWAAPRAAWSRPFYRARWGILPGSIKTGAAIGKLFCYAGDMAHFQCKTVPANADAVMAGLESLEWPGGSRARKAGARSNQAFGEQPCQRLIDGNWLQYEPEGARTRCSAAAPPDFPVFFFFLFLGMRRDSGNTPGVPPLRYKRGRRGNANSRPSRTTQEIAGAGNRTELKFADAERVDEGFIRPEVCRASAEIARGAEPLWRIEKNGRAWRVGLYSAFSKLRAAIAADHSRASRRFANTASRSGVGWPFCVYYRDFFG